MSESECDSSNLVRERRQRYERYDQKFFISISRLRLLSGCISFISFSMFSVCVVGGVLWVVWVSFSIVIAKICNFLQK